MIKILLSSSSKDQNYQVEHRKRVIQQVVVPFMLKAEASVVEQSMIRVIIFIMNTLSAPLLGDDSAPVEVADQLRLKISCFELVQVAYTQLTAAQVNTPTSLLNSEYYNSRSDWPAAKGGLKPLP